MSQSISYIRYVQDYILLYTNYISLYIDFKNTSVSLELVFHYVAMSFISEIFPLLVYIFQSIS